MRKFANQGTQLLSFVTLLPICAPALHATALHAMPIPQRIHFAPNAESATLRGYLSRQHSNAFYLVRVRAGQRLSIKVATVKPYQLESSIVPLLFVTSPSGKRTTDKITRFDTLNSEAGDYQIRVGVNQMATNGGSGAVNLKVWSH